MSDLAVRRRFYAEEIEAVAHLRTAPVVEALAQVERERFLPPGPWTVRSEADLQAPPRVTVDSNPRHVYHNVSVAIDSARMLFNGAPGIVAAAIDALAAGPGMRALHVGIGLGYYTAVLGACVGPTGRVLGIEIDADLAAAASRNLSHLPWVDVHQGDATGPLSESFDVMLISAGVTHPLSGWLDALAPGGRMMVPLTASFGPMPIGKGPMVLVTGNQSSRLPARFAGLVAIYSALGLRDQAMNVVLAEALKTQPFPAITAIRRDPHERDATCWAHGPAICISLSGT